MRVQLGSALIAAVAGVGMFSGTPSGQNADGATDGTPPSACSSTTTSCCTESAAGLLGARASTPSTTTVSTDAAIIIALDRCHQRLVTSGTNDAPSSAAPRWCADP